MKYHYVWLMWSSAFLMPWIILFGQCPAAQGDKCGEAGVFMPHLTKLPVPMLSGYDDFGTIMPCGDAG